MVEGGGGESRRGECWKENKAGAAKRRIRGRKKSGTRWSRLKKTSGSVRLRASVSVGLGSIQRSINNPFSFLPSPPSFSRKKQPVTIRPTNYSHVSHFSRFAPSLTEFQPFPLLFSSSFYRKERRREIRSSNWKVTKRRITKRYRFEPRIMKREEEEEEDNGRGGGSLIYAHFYTRLMDRVAQRRQPRFLAKPLSPSSSYASKFQGRPPSTYISLPKE